MPSVPLPGTIELGFFLYKGFCVALALVGVYLARLVTISDEQRASGRAQSYRETGPLTWIGIIVVGPIVWSYGVPLQFCAPLGLGTGYSVKIILKMFGGGVVGAIRAILRQGLTALGSEPVKPPPPEPGTAIEVNPPMPTKQLRQSAGIIPANTPLELSDETIAGLDQIPPVKGYE